jgi:UDP:flavonoid glycosyltransferase YjiC (YdhE family)
MKFNVDFMNKIRWGGPPCRPILGCTMIRNHLKPSFPDNMLPDKLDRSLYGSKVKQSERSVLPADPSLFPRLSNKGHINTRTYLPPAAPEEVACVPEAPVCIADNKAPWRQIPCTHPLCSTPVGGVTPDIRFFSNPFSFEQSFVTFIDSQSPIYRF